MGEEPDHFCAPGHVPQSKRVSPDPESCCGLCRFQLVRLGSLCFERFVGPGSGSPPSRQTGATVRLRRTSYLSWFHLVSAITRSRGYPCGYADMELCRGGRDLSCTYDDLLLAPETSVLTGCFLSSSIIYNSFGGVSR